MSQSVSQSARTGLGNPLAEDFQRGQPDGRGGLGEGVGKPSTEEVGLWTWGGNRLAGHRATAGKAVIGARHIGTGSVFQFDMEMCTEWRIALLVPSRT